MAKYINADDIEYTKTTVCYGHGWYEDEKFVLKEKIDEMPAADVRENVHGKWVKTIRVIKVDGADYYDPVWFCPACGQEYDAEFASHNVKYCYRCGTEMKGEQDA